MNKISLTDDDTEILKLEKKIRELYRIKDKTPSGNTEGEESIHKKIESLSIRQMQLVYDRGGNFREDKKHLLKGDSGCLNLDLLQEATK